jgi:hypothetical protein
VKRLFWIGVGVGLAYYASRWMRRQRDRFSPESVAARAAQGLGNVMELVRISVDEGRRAAAKKEVEIRAALGDATPDREASTPRP